MSRSRNAIRSSRSSTKEQPEKEQEKKQELEEEGLQQEDYQEKEQQFNAVTRFLIILFTKDS